MTLASPRSGSRNCRARECDSVSKVASAGRKKIGANSRFRLEQQIRGRLDGAVGAVQVTGRRAAKLGSEMWVDALVLPDGNGF